MGLHDDRKEYLKKSLDDQGFHHDPMVQFGLWLQEYRDTGAEDSTAFAISTVSSNGDPDSRIVLLKEVRDEQLIFFTNYNSKKGRDLSGNPRAHALFFWSNLERQVRILGSVLRIPRDESERYFASRPIKSQWGAAASQQSEPIANRAAMEDQLRLTQEVNPTQVPCPPDWGGFALSVDHIEFWQGRESRLHDRIRFKREPLGEWTNQRLQP
jgi:pyridoxamine 5'-phosphate oxidase